MNEVFVEWYIEEFIEELEKFLDENCEIIAKQIAADAKANVAFEDKTGALRRSIKAKKSKFPDGGWIAKAGGKGARQAWLVEHGHNGPGGSTVPPHPYLEPARVKNIEFARRQFGAK